MDYRSGIEAMVLAILQQTNQTLITQQHQAMALETEYLSAHGAPVSFADVIALYAAYLADALAMNANMSLTVQTNLLHLNLTSPLLPVRRNPVQ